MPFKLSPSGYCVFFHGESDNLLKGAACPSCRRVVGHHFDCIHYKDKDVTGETSRQKLFNAASVLWAKNEHKSFITFTLPSRDAGTYQVSSRCSTTGDLAITKKFSKVLEAWALRERRAGRRLSYVWVAEAQMKRQQKFGGVGDLHFHLVANVRIKDVNNSWTDSKGTKRYRVIDSELLFWLQMQWCNQIGREAFNCVHVDPIPDDIKSIPGYLTKYLGKGSPRMIHSRKYAASRDLSKYKPITLSKIPTADLEGSFDLTTKTGYEISLNFFNTRQILEEFGGAMIDESRFQGVTQSGKDFTPQAIKQRVIDRTWSQVREAYQDDPLPDTLDSHARMVAAARKGLSNPT